MPADALSPFYRGIPSVWPGISGTSAVVPLLHGLGRFRGLDMFRQRAKETEDETFRDNPLASAQPARD